MQRAIEEDKQIKEQYHEQKEKELKKLEQKIADRLEASIQVSLIAITCLASCWNGT